MLIRLSDKIAVRAEAMACSSIRDRYVRLSLTSGDSLDVYPTADSTVESVHKTLCDIMDGMLSYVPNGIIGTVEIDY